MDSSWVIASLSFQRTGDKQNAFDLMEKHFAICHEFEQKQPLDVRKRMQRYNSLCYHFVDYQESNKNVSYLMKEMAEINKFMRTSIANSSL